MPSQTLLGGDLKLENVLRLFLPACADLKNSAGSVHSSETPILAQPGRTRTDQHATSGGDADHAPVNSYLALVGGPNSRSSYLTPSPLR